MESNCFIAIVGAGVFAHNLSKVFSAAGCELSYVVDELKTGTYLNRPIVKAAELDADKISQVSKYVVAISVPEYRAAAIARLEKQGVPAHKIFSVADDPTIPILDLIFSEHGQEALAYFRSESCCSLYELEKYFYGAGWEAALQTLDPDKKTLAFCFYGRGGGFRRHIGGLIPRLKPRFNILTLMDERLPDSSFQVPELYMGPETAEQFVAMDVGLTAHFIGCSPADRPKVNFLHTSFDFILEPEWIIDRFDSADPHYVFTSTKATFDWMKELVSKQKLQKRLCLIPGGYTRLDENLHYAEKYAGPVDSIIYAPTLSLNAVRHHQLTYSAPWGAEIVQALLAAFPDKQIIFRPHPNDLQLLLSGRDDELAKPFAAILKLCEEHPRCVLDGQKTFYMDSYNRSAVMISDTSSTAYTYALSTCRPVVFFSPNDDEVTRIFSSSSAFIRDREQIGQVATSTEQMVAQVTVMLDQALNWQERVRRYREEVCFNLGRTEEYFVENIDYILKNQKHPDWYYYNW